MQVARPLLALDRAACNCNMCWPNYTSLRFAILNSSPTTNSGDHGWTLEPAAGSEITIPVRASRRVVSHNCRRGSSECLAMQAMKIKVQLLLYITNSARFSNVLKMSVLRCLPELLLNKKRFCRPIDKLLIPILRIFNSI